MQQDLLDQTSVPRPHQALRSRRFLQLGSPAKLLGKSSSLNLGKTGPGPAVAVGSGTPRRKPAAQSFSPPSTLASFDFLLEPLSFFRTHRLSGNPPDLLHRSAAPAGIDSPLAGSGRPALEHPFDIPARTDTTECLCHLNQHPLAGRSQQSGSQSRIMKIDHPELGRSGVGTAGDDISGVQIAGFQSCSGESGDQFPEFVQNGDSIFPFKTLQVLGECFGIEEVLGEDTIPLG